MASSVDICNRALILVGASTIVSLTEDSKSARLCNILYEPAKKELLEMAEWAFAIKRASLAADAVPPTFGKTNAFQLPADFLHLADDYPERQDPFKDWEIEGRKIYTNNSDPLDVRYIYDVVDTNLMPFTFQNALAGNLAVKLTEALTQSNSKKVYAAEYFKEAMQAARKVNAFRKVPKSTPTDSWITARI